MIKKILLAVLVIGAFASCKKSKDNTCDVSVSAMAGNYKITKYTYKVPNIPDQDLTSTLTNCEKSGVYHLNADKSASYTNDASCLDDETGSWNVVDGKITITVGYDLVSMNVAGWNCNRFYAEQSSSAGGITVTYSLEFTKQ